MAYSKDAHKAETIVRALYNNKVDKAGQLYYGHLLRVAYDFDTDEERVIGWLHDIVEDDLLTIEEVKIGFGEDTAEAIDAISRRKDESYMNYIVRVKKNSIARRVKIRDLVDNSNLGRLQYLTIEDVKRQAKYNKALMKLMQDD